MDISEIIPWVVFVATTVGTLFVLLKISGRNSQVAEGKQRESRPDRREWVQDSVCGIVVGSFWGGRDFLFCRRSTAENVPHAKPQRRQEINDENEVRSYFPVEFFLASLRLCVRFPFLSYGGTA